MTVRTVNNLPAAAHGETVRCLFAIELSKQSWVIGFTTPLSAKISCRILRGGDWRGLLELIEEMRARVGREIGRAVEVMSCYEAGYDGFWLHRQLEAHGVRNYVIDPASLQVDRRVRRAKTDRIDTVRLLRSLMAYLRGEPKVCSVCRCPALLKRTRVGCTVSGCGGFAVGDFDGPQTCGFADRRCCCCAAGIGATHTRCNLSDRNNRPGSGQLCDRAIVLCRLGSVDSRG